MNGLQSSKAALGWVLVLMLGLASGAGADSSERVGYFSALAFRESPYSDFRGVVPLTAEEANRRNHFRFEYDELGHITELSFRLGDRLRPLNHAANHFLRSSIVRISYRDGLEVRRFFDHRGQPVLVAGSVYEERFELDSRGRRRTLRFFDLAGTPVESSWGIATYRWRNEPDGSVVERREGLDGRAVWMRPGLEFGTLRLRYDARGQIASMENLDRGERLLENATGVAADRLSFDGAGRFLGWAVLDAAGRPQRGNSPDVARGVVTPDRWGYEASIRYEDELGRPIRNSYGWGGSRTDYDDVGNMLARRFVDADGRAMLVEEVGYHGYDLEWSDCGHLQLALSYVDLAGKPVAHRERGYSEVRHEYDAGGNRTATRFLGLNGELIERLDRGVAVIERDFGDSGQLLEARNLDANGELVDDRTRGYAVLRFLYDEAGRPAGSERLLADGTPLDSGGG